MKRFMLLVFVLLAVNMYTLNFIKDLNAATNLAYIEKKKIVLFFESKTCHYCQLLNSTTLNNKEVLDFLYINYIPVIIYSDEQPEMFYIFKVHATPTMWFLQLNKGKLEAVTYVPGYLPADLFLKVLKYVYKLPEEDFKEYAKKVDNFKGERMLINITKKEANYVIKNDPNAILIKDKKQYKGEVYTYVTYDVEVAKWLKGKSYRVLLVEVEKDESTDNK